jgi:SAM-dependent methyltransferase
VPDDTVSLPENLSAKDGFTAVDAQPDTSFLVNTMYETSRWPSVQRLRAWEREHLALRPGERLLDVGCGVGDALCVLVDDLRPGGSGLGLDASEAMLTAARDHAASNAVTEVEFRSGDAVSLDVPDSSFDACRSERMLQWVPEMELAVGEMVRALRPGGRLSLIDTDWRTFAPDMPDTRAYRAVTKGLYEQRGPSAAAGARLLNICRDLGLSGVEVTADAHVWSQWDPTVSPAPDGFFPIEPVVTELVDLGHVEAELGQRFIEQVYDSARNDRLFISLTMVAVSGRKPR